MSPNTNHVEYDVVEIKYSKTHIAKYVIAFASKSIVNHPVKQKTQRNANKLTAFF